MPNPYDVDTIKIFVLNNNEIAKKKLISQVTDKNLILQDSNDHDFMIHQKGDTNYKLALWAIPDGPYILNQYRGAHVALICVDLTDLHAISQAENHYRNMERYGNESVIIIFVGINAELANDQVIRTEDVQHLSKQYNKPYIRLDEERASIDELINTVVTSYRQMKGLDPVEEKIEVKERKVEVKPSFFSRLSKKLTAPPVVPAPAFPVDDLKEAIETAVSNVTLQGRLGQKSSIETYSNGSAQVKITAPKGRGGPLIEELKATEFYQQQIKGRYAVNFEVTTASKLAAATIHPGFESITVTFTPKSPENQVTFSSLNNNNNCNK